MFNFVNYVFLLLCMFRFGYSVSLCCSVYCLYVNVYCTTATGCQNPIAVNKYIISYQIFLINLEEIPVRDLRNFEEQNEDWEPFVNITNYCIFINVYYNYNF
jgi:hypothetical protein